LVRVALADRLRYWRRRVNEPQGDGGVGIPVVQRQRHALLVPFAPADGRAKGQK